MTLLAAPMGRAGQERYDYDAIGRLIRFTDSNNQVTEYTYDKAGNITSVTRGTAASQPPSLTGITPSVIRIGESRPLTLTGERLQVGTLQAADAGLDFSNLRQSATQIQLDLSVATSVPVGTQTLTFSNAQGTARIGLLIAPRLPTLSVEPSPVALPPDNAARPVTVRLSGPDVVPHQVTVISSDTNRVTVSPASVTLAAGQTTAQVNVLPKAAGFVNLTLSSPTLATTTVPVFVTADFRGVNTSYAQPVGVMVGDGVTPTVPQVSGTFASPQVGVAVGPVLTSLAPRGLPVGGTHALTVQGAGIPAGAQVAVVPAQGVTTSITQASSTQLGVQLIVDAAALPGARRLVVTDAAGVLVPFADSAQSQLVLTAGQPTISSIEPLFATRGSTMQLTVRGRHLEGGQLVVEPGIDLRVDSAPVINADGTELTARIQIASLAATGARTVRIVTPSGQSGAQASSANQLTIVTEIKEAVTPIASPLVGVMVGASSTGGTTTTVGPLVAPGVGVTVGAAAFQASPRVGVIGTSVSLVVTGTGLQAVTGVSILPADSVTAGAFAVDAQGARLTLPLTIDAAAPRTARRIVLTTADGKLQFVVPEGDQFLVAAPAPELISVTPQVIVAGKTTALTVRGVNFNEVVGVSFEPASGLVAAPPFAVAEGGTVLTVNVQAAAGAQSGPRTLVVTTAGGASSAVASPANTFQVAQQAGPTYDSIMAASVGVQVGSTTTQTTTTQAAYSPLVGVVLTTVPAPVEESRSAFAPNVGVLVGAGSTGLQPRSPDGLLKGAEGVVRVNGVGLGQVGSVRVLGPAGVSAGAPVANAEGTQLTIPLSVAASAPSAQYGIRLSTGAGTGTFDITPVDPSTMLFNVGALPSQIDSVSPIVLEQGKSYTFTVRGANLRDVYEVFAEPAGGLIFGVGLAAPQWSSDAFGEKLTVPVLIGPDAAIGSRVVRFKVPGGTTGAEPTPANTITIVAPQ